MTRLACLTSYMPTSGGLHHPRYCPWAMGCLHSPSVWDGNEPAPGARHRSLSPGGSSQRRRVSKLVRCGAALCTRDVPRAAGTPAWLGLLPFNRWHQTTLPWLYLLGHIFCAPCWKSANVMRFYSYIHFNLAIIRIIWETLREIRSYNFGNGEMESN